MIAEEEKKILLVQLLENVETSLNFLRKCRTLPESRRNGKKKT